MRKICAIMLSGVMLSSSVSMNVAAATKIPEKNISVNVSVDAPVSIRIGEPTGSKASPSQAALEAAIKSVKAKITIPAEYSEFDYYFNDATMYSEASWSMTWSTRDGDGQITVSCDNDYHITSFYQNDYHKMATGISSYLKKELRKTADDFILKVTPELANQIDMIEADFDGVYSGNYVYNYVRKEKGVIFPDNNVQVNVDSITGKVTAFYANWLYKAKLPSVDGIITQEEATKLIKNNMKMKLVYRSNYYRIYDQKGNTKKKAFLVYEPTQPYISIDAKTGKVYLTKSEWINTAGNMEFAKSRETSEAVSDFGSMQLTEEEMEKVKELKNIISKEKAIKLIKENPSLYIDENLTAFTSYLNKVDNNGKTTYVWNISLSDPREINYKKDKSYYRGYVYAAVDAVSGKILNFNANVKSYYDELNKKWQSVKVPYDQKESQKILEKFMKKQAGDRFSNTVLAETNNDYVVTYKKDTPVYGGYQYQYNRVHQGIEYPYNSLYGSVDGVTGKIYSFGSSWDENIEFESQKGAMTAEQAMEAYLSKDGFGLKYEINQITKYDDAKKTKDLLNKDNTTKVEYEVRLVYNPDINPSNLSPFSGEQISQSGEVYKKAKPLSYQDLKDEAMYRNILLLADMNIGFEGDNFLPNQEIKAGELEELLNKIGYVYDYSEKNSVTTNTSLITREEIARTFITKLGLEKQAALKGIYKTGYEDEGSIDEKYLGAVALAKGYGLMKADKENKFNPKGKVTRFDAVNLILSYIEVQRSGVN